MEAYEVRGHNAATSFTGGSEMSSPSHPSYMSALIIIVSLAAPLAYAAERSAPSDPSRAQSTAVDNTRVNKADKGNAQLTPQGQGKAQSDRDRAAAIRKAVVKDKSLSTYAHNVKIVVKGDSVTLRGPVRGAQEKDVVGEHARQEAGDGAKIDNRLTVKVRK
ncbi:MAG: BON domain-containing protein [Burkholderiales bacterium]